MCCLSGLRSVFLSSPRSDLLLEESAGCDGALPNVDPGSSKTFTELTVPAREEMRTGRKRKKDAKLKKKAKDSAQCSPASPWDASLDGLTAFPMSATTLDPSVKVAELDPESRELAFSYITGCMKASPELRTIFESFVAEAPQALRVKELFETMECFKQAADFAVQANKVRPIECIYDLACGHGFLGALLAYRFPHKRIVCVDLERRSGFDHLVRAFEMHGEAQQPTSPNSTVLGNLEFFEGDLSESLREMKPESFALSVHGCHEATRDVIEGARAAGSAWGVMPCCIRDGIYLPCGVKGAKVSMAFDATGVDDIRHALLCGAVAAKYQVERLNCIDRRITNRNIFLFGGAGFGSRENYLLTLETALCARSVP